MAPESSAASPYCTPTLSSGLLGKPVAGSTPSWLTICSSELQMIPFGFVGLHCSAGGMIVGLQLPVAVDRFANVLSHDTHVV